MRQSEQDWKELFPGNPFNYFFLDDQYNNQYKADQQFGEVFTMFAFLAIFIACLGLFGLSSLTAIQRTKEIGVRKVMGASISGILVLVGKGLCRPGRSSHLSCSSSRVVGDGRLA